MRKIKESKKCNVESAMYLRFSRKLKQTEKSSVCLEQTLVAIPCVIIRNCVRLFKIIVIRNYACGPYHDCKLQVGGLGEFHV